MLCSQFKLFFQKLLSDGKMLTLNEEEEEQELHL